MIFKFLRHVSYHFCYTLGKMFENRGRHFENFTYILTIYSVMFIVTNDSPFINFYVSSFLPFAVHKSNFPSSIQTPIGLTKFQCGILLSRGPRSVYPQLRLFDPHFPNKVYIIPNLCLCGIYFNFHLDVTN